MTSPHAVGNEYDARIQRADKLIAEKSSASQLLSFYRRIASFQKSFLTQIAEGTSQEPEIQPFGALRDALDLTLLLPHFRNFLSLVEQNAPNALAAAAREIAAAARAGKADQADKAFTRLELSCKACHDLHPENRVKQ